MTEIRNPGPLTHKALAVRQQISDRLDRGSLDYERDMRNLAHELVLMMRLDEPVVAGRILTIMGIIEARRAHFIAAYDYFKSAELCFAEAGDEHRVIAALGNIGELYRYWEKHDQAFAYYQTALEKAQAGEDWEQVAWLLNNIGMAYLTTGRPAEALPLLEQSLDYKTRHNIQDRSADCETYCGIAQARLHLRQYAAAWESAQLALKLSEARNNIHEMGVACRVLGMITAQHPASSEAPQDYFKRSRDLFYLKAENRAEYAETLVEEARWLLDNQNYQAAQNNLAQAGVIFSELKLGMKHKQVEALSTQVQQHLPQSHTLSTA